MPINLYNSIDANNTSGYWQGPSNLSSDYQGLFNPLENSVGLYNYIILNNNELPTILSIKFNIHFRKY